MSRAVVIDFDGTVTEDDLLDKIALGFGDPAVYQEVEDGLDAGTMPLREVITREFAPVTAPLDEVVAWVLEHARVRAGFREFVEEAQAAGWEVHVVSSGFHELIEPVLEREGVAVLLHANRVDASPEGLAGRLAVPRRLRPLRGVVQARAPPGGVRRLRRRRLLGPVRRACLRSRLRDVPASRRYLAERGTPFEPFSDFRALSAALANGIVTPPS